MGKIEIYCDGSCKNNGSSESIAGIGVVLNYIVDGKIKKTRNISEAIPGTGMTNNYAEIYAAIRGLQVVTNRNIPIKIYSDSQYLINTMNLGWARRYNISLWDTLYDILLGFKKIEFCYVKGHSGNKYNELADKLAGESYGE